MRYLLSNIRAFSSIGWLQILDNEITVKIEKLLVEKKLLEETRSKNAEELQVKIDFLQ